MSYLYYKKDGVPHPFYGLFSHKSRLIASGSLVVGDIICDVIEGHLLVVAGSPCRLLPTMMPADWRWRRFGGDFFVTLGERLEGDVWEWPRMKSERD